MSDADHVIEQIRQVTSGYLVGITGPTDEPPSPPAIKDFRIGPPQPAPAPLTEERVREIVREELDRLRPVFLPAAPPFRSEP